MLSWLRRGIGGSGGHRRPRSGVLDGIFHPGAARAREHLDAQHERVMPSPTPGDKLLSDGRRRHQASCRIVPALTAGQARRGGHACTEVGRCVQDDRHGLGSERSGVRRHGCEQRAGPGQRQGAGGRGRQAGAVQPRRGVAGRCRARSSAGTTTRSPCAGDLSQADTAGRLVAAASGRWDRLDGALISVGGPSRDRSSTSPTTTGASASRRSSSVRCALLARSPPASATRAARSSSCCRRRSSSRSTGSPPPTGCGPASR